MRGGWNVNFVLVSRVTKFIVSSLRFKYLADEERIGYWRSTQKQRCEFARHWRPASCVLPHVWTLHRPPCVCMPSGKHAANLESVDERRRTRKVLNDTWTTARRFADAAVHRDLRLDFEGFKCMMPPGML